MLVQDAKNRLMNGLLVRVGADQSTGGGNWNGPVDVRSRKFAYIPIPETKETDAQLRMPYQSLASALAAFGQTLPGHLAEKNMHLDPDFEHATYGDRGKKGRQISRSIGPSDLIVFYAGLRDTGAASLVYAIIGLFVVDRVVPASSMPPADAHRNAHTRRILSADADDIIVIARPESSGRLSRCIPIGEYRKGAYRVRSDLLAEWGGLSCADGFIQRSAVFPRLSNASKFWEWWKKQDVDLLRANNSE